MLGWLILGASTALDDSPSVRECSAVLESLSRPGAARRLAGPDLGRSRLYLSGNLEPSVGYSALATAYRAEWKRSGSAWHLAQTTEARHEAKRMSLESRVRAWTKAIQSLSKSVEPFRRPDAKEVARAYERVVEDYVERYRTQHQLGSIGAHPMRTLLAALVEKLGAKNLAETRPGQRRYFTTLEIPGTTRLTDVQGELRKFDDISVATADLLADLTSSGSLSTVSELQWLFGSAASWSPVRAVTIYVIDLADHARVGIEIDRGMPMPDGYSEDFELDYGHDYLSDLLETADDRSQRVEWSPATRQRYLDLKSADTSGVLDLATVDVPESLVVRDILHALSRAVRRPIVALLPPGLEATVSSKMRPVTTLGEALDAMGSGHFGLEALKQDGTIVLRPRNPELGRWSEVSARATRAYVREGLRLGATASDDYARYLAALDDPALSTREPGWWLTSMIRTGVAYRQNEATTTAYLLLGKLLQLAGREESLSAKLGRLPAPIQALARVFALSGNVTKEGSATSLSTVENAREVDWADAEIALSRRTVIAALWHTRGAKSLMPPREIANVVANWQPGMDEVDSPAKLRLQEGECEEFEVVLRLSPKLEVRQTFLGRLQRTGEIVTGVSALSEEFRTEIERVVPPQISN